MRRIAAVLALSFVSACAASEAAGPDAVDFVRPISGLTGEQLEQFERGRKLFEKTFTPPDGLGPMYNDTSCRACHGLPATGGGSGKLLTLVAGDIRGAQVPLVPQGGPVIQDKTIAGIPPEAVPAEARVISRRISPPTFGMGLIEAVSAEEVTARLAPTPEKQALGIGGRANWEFSQLGRFGWKSQKGDMIEFTQQASQFEMGLSSPGRPAESFPNVPLQKLAAPSHLDHPDTPWIKTYFKWREGVGKPMHEPDLSQQDVEDLAAFQRWQAPPERLPGDAATQRGEALFARVGCAECHTPSFTTAPNDFGVPAGLAVPLYSDLLVHDMGDRMSDGLIMGVAEGSDWRTMPLWGLRYREVYLHDGRSDDLDEAIRWHGGEAAGVIARYQRLSGSERQALLAFLETL